MHNSLSLRILVNVSARHWIQVFQLPISFYLYLYYSAFAPLFIIWVTQHKSLMVAMACSKIKYILLFPGWGRHAIVKKINCITEDKFVSYVMKYLLSNCCTWIEHIDSGSTKNERQIGWFRKAYFINNIWIVMDTMEYSSSFSHLFYRNRGEAKSFHGLYMLFS